MGSCCNLKSDIKTYANSSGPRIIVHDDGDDDIDNNIKIKISTNGRSTITMTINQKSLFSEVKKNIVF